MAAERHLSRRGFFLAIVAAPAALAACSRQRVEAPVAQRSPPAPSAERPRVQDTSIFAALRQVPLDRDVEPAFAFPAGSWGRRP